MHPDIDLAREQRRLDFRENSPLPPAVLSGTSVSRSPLVVITRISTRLGHAVRRGEQPRHQLACTSARAEPRVPSRKIGACDCNPLPSYCRPMAPRGPEPKGLGLIC